VRTRALKWCNRVLRHGITIGAELIMLAPFHHLVGLKTSEYEYFRGVRAASRHITKFVKCCGSVRPAAHSLAG